MAATFEKLDAGFLGLQLPAQLQKDPLATLDSLREHPAQMLYARVGPAHIFFLNHPDLIHEVLVTRAKSFVKWKKQKASFGKFNGNGLVNSDGDFWKRQRKMIQPAFHSQRIQNYAEIMVKFAQEAVDQWQDGAALNLSQTLSEVTMKIVAKTLFDVEVPSELERIHDAIMVVQEMATREMSAIFTLPDWLPLDHKKRERAAVQTLDEIIMEIIRIRRAENIDKGDLLSMMMITVDDQNQEMSDRQLRDEAMTLFIAGHETSAVAMTWAFYALATEPHAAERFYAEVDALEGRTPTFEDLPRLKYTGMVIKEAMRLYPPTWLFPREAGENVEIGGHHVPRGAVVEISPYLLQRDARFFPDPLRFDPERFSAENEPNIPRYAYFPFGGGPRVCIGNSFAMMEMQLLLATFGQRYRFELIETPEIAAQVTMYPKNGLRVRAIARDAVTVR